MFASGDGANYALCTRSQRTVLSMMRNSYTALGLTRVARWNPSSSIPPSYMLAKQKGPLEKYRPIRNCKVHAARVALNSACRVYSFLLEVWSAHHPNFNCANIHHYPARFYAALDSMVANTATTLGVARDDLAVKHVVSDIKDMYTCLPHDELMNAAHAICADVLKLGLRK